MCIRDRYNTQDFAVPSMESLKSSLIGRLITVTGSVLRVSTINVLVHSMEFACLCCKTRSRVYFANGKYKPVLVCSNTACSSKDVVPDRFSSHTSFFQRIRLQEIDSELKAVAAGKMPKTVECELRDDLVDSCVSGDIVEVSGILNPELSCDDKRSKGLFSSYLEVNSLVHKNCAYNPGYYERMPELEVPLLFKDILEEQQALEEQSLRNLSARSDILPLLIKSLCPQICGQEIVKYGLLLSLFGGTLPSAETRTRPDIHILMVGDPGLGKSQLLKCLVKASPRGFYICGKSTTSAGLTMAVCRDPSTNDQTLEAGALVLSDKGTCCIDEFDKMSSDHSTLLEVMEHQTVSIAKGGILCSLPARCSIVAAANPHNGRYSADKAVTENIKLSNAVASRFDLIFVMVDRPDEERDKKVTEHVLKLYKTRKRRFDEISQSERSVDFPSLYRAKRTQLVSDQGESKTFVSLHAEESKQPTRKWEAHKKLGVRLEESVEMIKEELPIEEMRKYIAFAREKISPKLSTEACDEIKSFYLRTREAEGEKASFPVTTRLLESLIRLAQARAKLELRESVTAKDAQEVVELLEECVEQCSPRQAFYNEVKRGKKKIDLTNVGDLSRRKQTDAFVDKLRMETVVRESDVFDYGELVSIGKSMRMNVGDFAGYVMELNNSGIFLMKGAQKYQLIAK
eukprot:TRINITY_DN4763_c0_g1_i11.p1 TRINITY_DN4763_c0_g1~~TRINITY_DN4763_c0_g1_i11.p1  ORF type:complete len:685 (+),score=179.22 TRINITY_DN4763_c0_g1_i11:80-2134(+)